MELIIISLELTESNFYNRLPHLDSSCGCFAKRQDRVLELPELAGEGDFERKSCNLSEAARA